MLCYKQSGVFDRRAAVNHQLRWPFARGGGDLPLPEPVRSAILASKRPAIWRMSDQSQPHPPRQGEAAPLDVAVSRRLDQCRSPGAAGDAWKQDVEATRRMSEEPDNLVLRLLQEIRTELASLRDE
jgi:hypothetical protein